MERFWFEHFGKDDAAGIGFDIFCSAFERYHINFLNQTLPNDFALALRFVLIPESTGCNQGADTAQQVRKSDFELFLKRFGPLSMSFRKSTECFFCQQHTQYGPGTMMVPWFHGTLSRQKAEELCQKDGINGTFLVRFSEREPDKFTLTYLKVEGSGARKKLKMRNCLIYNADKDGFCLTFPRKPKDPLFSSVGDFVRKNAAKLKVPCESSLSKSYKQAHGEWGREKLAKQAQTQQAGEDNYSHFATEDAGTTGMYGAFGGGPAAGAATGRSNSSDGADGVSSYGEFVAPPLLSQAGSTSSKPNGGVSPGAAEYGQFSSGAVASSPQHRQLIIQRHQQKQQLQQQPQQSTDLYGHFISPPSTANEAQVGATSKCNYGEFVAPQDATTAYGGFVAPSSPAIGTVAADPVYDDPYSVHFTDSSAGVGSRTDGGGGSAATGGGAGAAGAGGGGGEGSMAPSIRPVAE
jgi:hypothetical protein